MFAIGWSWISSDLDSLEVSVREVIMMVGTRGAGKSTFLDKTLACDPSIVGVSRDKILFDLFGSMSVDPYSGGFCNVYEKMWEEAAAALAPRDVRMILDAWNGSSCERQQMLWKLRLLGADRVVAWYFTTPLETVEDWFWKKPDVAKMSEMGSRQGQGVVFYSEGAPGRDHKLFHKHAGGIDSDGFDEVVRINPVVVEPQDVLAPAQTSLEL